MEDWKTMYLKEKGINYEDLSEDEIKYAREALEVASKSPCFFCASEDWQKRAKVINAICYLWVKEKERGFYIWNNPIETIENYDLTSKIEGYSLVVIKNLYRPNKEYITSLLENFILERTYKKRYTIIGVDSVDSLEVLLPTVSKSFLESGGFLGINITSKKGGRHDR